MATLKAVRGTRDLLPPETALWNRIEASARRVFARYNFGEIRTPIFIEEVHEQIVEIVVERLLLGARQPERV